MSARNHAQWIKDEALKLGFLSCGISEACFLEDEAPKLEKWLNQNPSKLLCDQLFQVGHSSRRS